MTIEDKGCWLFGVNAVINWVVSIRGAIAMISLVALLGFKKITEPILILGAGIAGIVLHRGA